MPRSQHLVEIPQGQWVELTANDVQNATFLVLGGKVEVRRDSADLPEEGTRGWQYKEGQGERDIALAQLSTHAGNRLWAFGLAYSKSEVLVDHA